MRNGTLIPFNAKRAVARLGRRRIAVLKGGWSRERAISLRSGAAVAGALRRTGLRCVEIDVRRDIASALARRRVDVCVIALHGPFGEDGRLQGLLDLLGIPYTGSGALASAVAMNKACSKRLFRDAGVPTAPWLTVGQSEFDDDPGGARARVARLLARGPVFVKPVDQGSAIGVSSVARPGQIASALRAVFAHSAEALVERKLVGREITVGILGDAPLPVVEIIPQHRFYDYHSKYAAGGSRHLVPARLSPARAAAAQRVALAAFRTLGCRAYGRVDLIDDRRLGPVVLEVNTIPGMTATSLLPDAARAAGVDFDELVLRMAAMALDGARTST